MTKTKGRGRPAKPGVEPQKIKEDYLDTSKTVSDICTAHGIDPHQMYRHLDSLNVPRRESQEFSAYAEGDKNVA